MGLSSIRFVCCRRHSKIRSIGCRMVPHGLSPLCCWNRCGFRAACRMLSLSKLPPLQRIRTRQRTFPACLSCGPVRLRAFFTTLAYTSIDQEDWFGFGECEQFVDQVFQWLHLCHGGQRAPIQFYSDAFNSTCSTFQSAVRANRTLNSVIGNLSEYQHFWTVFVANSKGDNTEESRTQRLAGRPRYLGLQSWTRESTAGCKEPPVRTRPYRERAE